jgi:hypothetical protein
VAHHLAVHSGVGLCLGLLVLLHQLLRPKFERELVEFAREAERHLIVGKGGTGVLSVDGGQVATQTIPHTISFLYRRDC